MYGHLTSVNRQMNFNKNMKVIIDYKLLTSSGQGNVVANDECFNSLLEGIKLEVTRRTLLACKNRINIGLFFQV